MNTTRKQHDWNARVSEFNDEYYGRPTRLGVFEALDGSVNDYWLEDGLPLRGVTFEETNGRVSAEFLFDGFTHTVENTQRIELVYGRNGNDDGINVIDAEGTMSILRFE